MRSFRVAVAVCGALWRSSRDNNVCQQRCVCHGKVPYKVERSGRGWVHTDMALPPPAKKKREEPLPRPEMEVSRPSPPGEGKREGDRTRRRQEEDGRADGRAEVDTSGAAAAT